MGSIDLAKQVAAESDEKLSILVNCGTMCRVGINGFLIVPAEYFGYPRNVCFQTYNLVRACLNRRQRLRPLLAISSLNR